LRLKKSDLVTVKYYKSFVILIVFTAIFKRQKGIKKLLDDIGKI